MAGITVRSFDSPDESRSPDKARVDLLKLGSVNAARFTMEPGWRWSESIKPLVGTDTCGARHVGAAISGRLHVTHSDGSESDIGPGEAYVIEPGHDAWVVGNEPFQGYEFESTTAESYGAGS